MSEPVDITDAAKDTLGFVGWKSKTSELVGKVIGTFEDPTICIPYRICEVKHESVWGVQCGEAFVVDPEVVEKL